MIPQPGPFMSVNVSRSAGVVQGGVTSPSVVRAGIWYAGLRLNLGGGPAPPSVPREPSQ